MRTAGAILGAVIAKRDFYEGTATKIKCWGDINKLKEK